MRSWTAHLSDRATPEALVNVINKKKINAAMRLRDELKREFNLESREACMSYDPKCESNRTQAWDHGQTVLFLGIGMVLACTMSMSTLAKTKFQ